MTKIVMAVCVCLSMYVYECAVLETWVYVALRFLFDMDSGMCVSLCV